jgi:hypothetical protein
MNSEMSKEILKRDFEFEQQQEQPAFEVKRNRC